MSEIVVKISKGSTEVSNQATAVTSSNLLDLLTALKEAKEQSNAILTKLVEESKDKKVTRRIPSENDDEDEEDEDSCPEEEDGNARKKQSS